MSEKLVTKINKVANHRNGTMGAPFHVVTFESNKTSMVGILFDDPFYCAILDINLLAQGNVEFGNGNSWRGEYYEPELRKAIEVHNNRE